VNSPFCNEPGQHDYGIGVDMAGILGVWGGAHGERRRRSLGTDAPFQPIIGSGERLELPSGPGLSPDR